KSSMLLLPLLLFFALLNPSSGAEGFDANRCKDEMMCFVPGSCISENINSLTRWPDAPAVDKCPVVIAIRPYSDKKWLVAMLGKGTDLNGLQLKISDKLKFECKPDITPGNATINVVPATSKGRELSTVRADNYILCEFEAFSDHDIVTAELDKEIVFFIH
ncbi:hypothetical protein PRIPAC_81876, partial [Pristionchus pacificus]|uniref:Uncharacterized protein n=1 Tax=Pristionchus pacificus TaxID=54126 RepID=A0A2A6BVK4_PRIPA